MSILRRHGDAGGPSQRVRTYTRVALGAWTLIAALLVLLHFQSHTREMNLLARTEATAFWRKDILYRYWSARHGGVYVPPTDTTPPNPYLSAVPDRDVVTTSGKRLTLINPAYMSRQVSDLGREKFGIHTRITSLRPLNPANAPDPWEAAALSGFEKGATEASAVTPVEGKPHMRFIRPISVEQGCLKCHAAQGYKVGDVRGAVSVAIPMEPFAAFRRSVLILDFLAIGFLWAGGGAAILFGGRRIEEHVARAVEGEERYRSLYTDTPAMLQSIDRDGRVVMVSDTWLSRLGHARDDVVGKESVEFLTGDSALVVRDVIMPELVRNGFCADVPCRMVRKDGGIVDVLVSARSETTADGRIARSMAVIEDVTERNRVRLELERTNASLVLAQRIARLGSWEWDTASGAATRSAEASRLLGDETAGADGERRYFLGRVHPEDAERVNRALDDALEGTRDFDIEYRVILPGMKDRLVHARAEVIRADDGSPVLVRGTTHDVTARKQVDDALYFVAQCGWAASGDNFFPALARYLGEAVGMDYVLIDRLTDERETAETVALYARGNVVPNMRYSLRGTPCENVMGKKLCCYERGVQGLFPNDTILVDMGAECYLGIPLWDSAGKPIGLIAVLDSRPLANADAVTDVLQIIATRAAAELERKRADAEKEKLQAQLQQAMKMEAIGQLAGGVAHDFNNLLTVISGSVSLARMKLRPSDPISVLLDEAGKAAERAAALTRQLLVFSRKQIIEPRVVDLNELIGGLQPMLERLIGEHIELRIERGDGLRNVRIDRGQFEQILVNLAVNARDAMPNGGTLAVGTANVAPDDAFRSREPLAGSGEFVVLAVSDTGCGMPQAVREKLFEPFFTTKPKGFGTGLGLSVTYGAVRQAGGFIEVFSEEGRGATFRIFLPAVAADVDAAPQPVGADGEIPCGTGTVLLVEDEVAVRELATHFLERLGYRVLTAGEGVEAIAVARGCRGRIDLLMTDVVLPGMNGRELSERLAPLHPEMKILFTSGYTDDAIVRFGVLDAGIHFIGKPYSLSSLATKIREILGASC